MKKIKLSKIWAVVITIFFLGTTLVTPSFSAASYKTNEENIVDDLDIHNNPNFNPIDYIMHDRYYAPPQDMSIRADQNDIGYNVDAGDKQNRANNIYIGEPVDDGPGKGRVGYLDPDDDDLEDWYRYTVCEGQSITASLDSVEDYDFELINTDGDPVANGYIAVESGWHYIHIIANMTDNADEYEINITLGQQNDAGTGDDAGDSIDQETLITPGSYYGYLDSNDHEDWYSFEVNDGEGIFVEVGPKERSDYDVYLYNPMDELVHYESYYGKDELEYPADVSGIWKIKIDIFPGWNTSEWPDDYYLYGSGLYDLDVIIGGDAEEPVSSDPQPEIQPIAQTFIIENDPESNKDEYSYIAAVPAANYYEGGDRFVSPIIYQGDETPTNWYGDVDDTTQYLIDDWNDYLDRHSMISTEYELSSDPIEAASDIATENWVSTDKAVVVVDGSNYEDSVRKLVNRNGRLNARTKEIIVPPDSEDFIDLGGGLKSYPMFIGPQWGAIAVHGLGNSFSGEIGITTPRYEALMEDWWPFPNDANGPDLDVYYPVTLPGFWMPYTSSVSGMDEMKITLIAGKRYRIPITSTDSSLKVTVTTDDPSYLRIYIIDPYGNVRRPQVPHWNGGPINPLHTWNGGHWDGIGFDDWRSWEPTLSTEHVEEIHYPMKGFWKVIVVPSNLEAADTTYSYHITTEVRKHSPQRNNAAMSAANGAVIASSEHIPLLYVTEDTVPSETQDALDSLGIEDVIFVGINDLGSQVKDELNGYTLTDLNTMQDVIDYIDSKNMNEDNMITITSLGTGDGYFAPSSMIAAYHTSPILNIGEAPDAYNTIDKIAAWREYAGDFYHGCRSVGHLPLMDAPFDFQAFIEAIKNKEFPAPGFDLKKRWFTEVNTNILELIDGYGLDKTGQEAYLFVSPRDTDIRDVVGRSMTGNLSYAGQIPVETPAFSSAVICRDILYPAIIYANPGRDVTTSQLMNYPDGGTWNGNDGNAYSNYATRELKRIFSSDGRFFEGHCIWDNYLERLNAGASISYYTGHGTGGSGISAQYKNFNEQFPQGELVHENLKDFDWWDSWRGYSAFDNPTTRSPRWGGSSGYNSKEPSLYDIIHFKYVDESFDNLHSEMDFWESCTTGAHFGPMIYLEHGSAFWSGNAGSCYGIQATLLDNWVFHDVLIEGKNIGESFSKYFWIFDRDFTTGDPATMYGRSSLFQGYLSNVQVLFGDPTMTCYNPNWDEPIPIST